MEQVWRHNWGYKLVSLLLAILLWIWIPAKVHPNTDMIVPLQVKGVPNNLVVTSKIPSSVTVTVQGANASEISAVIDMSAAVKGEKSYPVLVTVPTAVKTYSVEPNTISVTLDELKEKSVPVRVNLTGAVAEGYDKGNPVVRPATVTVRGPEKKLAEIDKAIVEVNLASATESIQASAAVRFQDASGKPIVGQDPTRPIIVAQPEEVSVIISVTKKDLASKTVPIRLTTKGNPANGFVVGQLLSTPEVVKIFGAVDKLASIESLNGGVIDVTGANQDVVMDIKPENLGLPTGITLEPGVKLSGIAHLVPGLVDQTLPGLSINVRGLVQGLSADLSLSSIDVVVRGTPDAIKSLKNTDKLLWVDATGMTAGQQKEVQVYRDELPPGVEFINLPKITITVK
jgi:YbbR domain-containing protein